MSDLEVVRAFLNSQSTLTLATVSDRGIPHATPLFYLLHGGLQLYWVSFATSLHSLNLANSIEVSAAVYCAADRWKQIRGVQMQGTVQRVTEAEERQPVLAEYVHRFDLGNLFESSISASHLYKYVPIWLRYLDNSKGFGYKHEISLPRHDPSYKA